MRLCYFFQHAVSIQSSSSASWSPWCRYVSNILVAIKPYRKENNEVERKRKEGGTASKAGGRKDKGLGREGREQRGERRTSQFPSTRGLLKPSKKLDQISSDLSEVPPLWNTACPFATRLSRSLSQAFTPGGNFLFHLSKPFSYRHCSRKPSFLWAGEFPGWSDTSPKTDLGSGRPAPPATDCTGQTHAL